ncbi:MAG TPA: ABC transporter ATP-binding protein [Candidatus Dormibacteraeota bacterium]|nr:ABC transporter ATP-binding protein [Candidatus Dormibacteraeota bacterium]
MSEGNGTQPILDLRDVHAGYGAIRALHGVTLSVPERTIVALLGANGAGKTTTLKAISGSVRAHGQITFGGRSLIGSDPADTARLGIAHVPEGRGTMGSLTVSENLRLGAYTRRDREIGKDMQQVYSYFPVLKDRQSRPAGLLSGGEQQMLAIGRALMSRPKLLLLDEPSLGLAPLIVKAIFELVRRISEDSGTAVLLVEQNAVAALNIAHEAYVLEVGRVTVHGSSEELKRSESVRRSYLGY